MAATYGDGAGTLSSILKEFYLGPIQETLNQETLVVELMEKASVDWNGRHVFIPVHTGRNADVGFTAEGAALPGAAVVAPVGAGQPQQTYRDLIVTAAFLYGKFAITGPAIAAAGKGSANSFVGYVDAEMTRLKDDVRNASNRAAVSGGRVFGFLTEPNVVIPVGPGAATAFDGDAAKAAVVLAALAGADNCTVIQLDTYVAIGDVEISAVGAGELTLIGAPLALPATTGPGGQALPYALVPNAAAILAMTAAGTDFTANEPTGIYGNLADPAHFSINRAAAAGASLRGQFLTSVADGGAGAPAGNAARVAMSLDGHFQRVTDIIAADANGSEEAPDCLLVNPAQRSRLAALLAGTVNMDIRSSGKAGHGDGGFTGFSYAGVPVKVSRHVDNGLIIHLNTKTWKMCELSPAEFADLDGSVLSRVANADAWEGFMKWYYDCVCTRPGANAIVTGLVL